MRVRMASGLGCPDWACVREGIPEHLLTLIMDAEDVSTEMLVKLWPWFEANRNRLIWGTAVLLLAALAFSFISWHRGQNEIASGEAFTQLELSPTPGQTVEQTADGFMALAARYPGTEAAQRAELLAAARLFEAGKYAEAQPVFENFAEHHQGPLAAIATLGWGAALEAQGKLDLATTAYTRLSTDHAEPAAYLQAEFALGRLAEQSGRLAEAETYYQNAAQAGQAGGSTAQEAAGRAYQLKQKIAAQQAALGAKPSALPTLSTNLIFK